MFSTFHILPDPSSVTSEDTVINPFVELTLTLIKMLKSQGHRVIHYGNESSVVECEHITVTSDKTYKKVNNDYKLNSTPSQELKDEFYKNTKPLLEKIDKNDAVLCCYGTDCLPAIPEGLSNAVIEPLVGYQPYATFAKYKVYSSYAWMNYSYGYNKELYPPLGNEVIHHYVDPSNFTYSNNKQDYILFLGRVVKEKGIEVVLDLALSNPNLNFVVAGPPSTYGLSNPLHKLILDGSMKVGNINLVGPVGLDKRKELLRDAKALIMPTQYVEPFGKVILESFLSGTPVIGSNFGALAELIQEGENGFKCNTLEDYLRAINNLNSLNNYNIYYNALKEYSFLGTASKYSKYFSRIHKLHYK